MMKKHITTGKMIKLIFYYKNKPEYDILIMTHNEFVEMSKRIFEKIGVLKVKGYKYDLTMVKAINIEFLDNEELIL